MRSTFMGLEISKRGMFTQQGALYTTGNNISNVNTPGYTRQRVNFEATTPYPSVGMNRPQIAGQMGTGVQAGSVQRVRESFLDIQYRQENNKLGYWQSRAQALEKMEEIMNEPSDSGLSKTLNDFWQSFHDLAKDTQNTGAREVVRQRGYAVAEAFKYTSTSLKQIQGDLKNELNVSVDEINSIATQLNNLNKQISEIEPHGYLPNELYDERDRLLDRLSTLASIKVTNHPSGGNALSIAEGTVSVEILDKNGDPIPAGTPLVNSDTTKSPNVLKAEYNDGGDGPLVEHITLGGVDIDINNISKTGKISSLIDSNGYISGGTENGLYPKMLKELDEMAFAFVQKFNDVHSKGKPLTTDTNGEPVLGAVGINFFSPLSSSKDAASLIKVSTEIENDTNNIAAAAGTADPYDVGNGENAKNLAEVKNGQITINGSFSTVQKYLEGLIGRMAVDAQEAEKMTNNSGILCDAVDQRRQSVSAVSLDEEMTNMIQFQHAYNASARMITLQDEILDKIINGMGLSR